MYHDTQEYQAILKDLARSEDHGRGNAIIWSSIHKHTEVLKSSRLAWEANEAIPKHKHQNIAIF